MSLFWNGSENIINRKETGAHRNIIEVAFEIAIVPTRSIDDTYPWEKPTEKSKHIR